ncbi:MTCH [Acanthosepion pharaonis]|uniref:MTCH n=1 Tax=Acanthosepion pharaonis TaxID=158019 RepID=A0A812BNN2_ACAPH|nr:MTCH [Sepia pharaonis]
MSKAEHTFSAFLTTAFYPVSYAKFLIQIGHEPLPFYETRTFTGRPILAYPSVFRYVAYIYRVDGFLGLYRGLFSKVLAGATGSIIQNKMLTYLKVDDDREKLSEDSDEDNGSETEYQDDDMNIIAAMKTLSKLISKQLAARSVAVIATHPFHVIMARNMAQFVGGEKEYNGILSSIRMILKHDGPSGFFGGLVPRLLGDSINLVATGVLTYILNKYVIQDKKATIYTAAFVGLVVNQLAYPFTLVSTIMMVSGSGLVAALPPNMPEYTSWIKCWNKLDSIGQLKRGSSLLWRVYSGPTGINSQISIKNRS